MENNGITEWQCMPNCGECCGVILIPKEIAVRHYRKVMRKIVKAYKIIDLNDAVVAFTEDNKCVFLDYEMRCAIYEERPLACRQFGKIDDIICPYINVNGKRRDPREINPIRVKMQKMVMDQFELLKSILDRKKEGSPY